MKKYFVLLLIIFVFVSIAVFKKKEPGKFVKVAKSKRKDLSETVSGTGVVKPVKTVNIMSEVMGKIVDLPVKEGDFVKKGQLLCKIDDKNSRSEVNRLKAEVKRQELILEKQKIDFKRAKQEFLRKKKLFESGILSKEDFESVENAFNSAKLNVKQQEFYLKQTKASLEKAMENLSKTRILAPIDGKITSLKKEIGEQVIQGTINNPGSIIMVLSDMKKLELEIDVNEVDAVLLKKGMNADIYLDSFEDKVFKGKVKQISESAEKPMGKDVSVFKVKIGFEEENPDIKPGMSGKAEITVKESKSTIVVPIECLRKDENEKEFCFVVEHGIAKKRFVETGISNDFEVEITKGLKEGETVVKGPYRVLKNLEDGEKVKFKNEP